MPNLIKHKLAALAPETLYWRGEQLARRFCEANNIPTPFMRVGTLQDACGQYDRRGIVVDLDQCARPGYAGRAWSWPSYVIDRTPYGVVLHELGHHVDRSMGMAELVRSRTGEKPLTGYSPNSSEWFAEMFRLFATNPGLLQLLRPRTYTELREYLDPVVQGDWRKVLAGAPARTLAMAEKKIANL